MNFMDRVKALESTVATDLEDAEKATVAHIVNLVGDALALLERGVIALEKLAGIEK